MIGRCAECGTEVMRYGGSDVMHAACEVCGSFIFWCLHWGVYGSQGHWVKIDLQTNKLLTPDPCDGWKEANG